MKKGLIDRLIKSSKTVKICACCAIAMLLGVLAFVIIISPRSEMTISFESSLKEIIESSDLSTSRYTYNSIAKVKIDPEKGDDEKNIKYYVAYKGTVKSGFNFENIEIVEKDDSIIVIVPKIEIQSVEVNPDMEYIFTKAKYDTENTYAEAFNFCSADLKAKAEVNQTLRQTAIDSAIETMKALTKPFENQLEDKTLEIVYIEEYKGEVTE